jgi:hypothetical protein
MLGACLDPRMHRNARACGLARSAARDGAREHAALGAIRSGTRNAKWAGGSRSQTHRRAAKGGFTQDDVKVRRPWGPVAASFVPRLLPAAVSFS